MEDLQRIFEFINYSERLKTELRHATKSDHARESVADHSWRLALVLILLAPKLKINIDLLRAIKIAIIHDLVEIEAHDVPILEQVNNQKTSQNKEVKERVAISKIGQMLKGDGEEILSLWNEFEKQETSEAKVVKALDKLEGQLQFLQDPIRRFTPEEQNLIDSMLTQTSRLCEIDPVLKQFDKLTLKHRKKRISYRGAEEKK